MNEPEDFGTLEFRLQEEAEQLGRYRGKTVTARSLEAESGRRRRVQWRMAGAAVGLALLTTAALSVRIRTHGEPDRPHFPLPAIAQDHTLPTYPQDTRIGPRRPHLQDPLMAQPPSGEWGEYPLLVTVGDGHEQRIIATGVYLPPQVESVRLEDLAPAEQAVIRRVIATEQEVCF
jgi:hypothetical protein